MEWRCVDDEHDKSTTRKDPNEVVLVANYAFPEWETNLCLDSKDLRKAVGRMSNRCQNFATYVEALGKEDRQVYYIQQLSIGIAQPRWSYVPID